jgi:very-short-patch-repair endonuclease
MKSGKLSESDRTLTQKGLEQKSRLARKNDVLLVRGSELHKRIPIGVATRDVAFNQDVKALRAKNGISSTYLYYWLTAHEPMLLSKVEHTGIGAGKLDTAILKALPVEVPPVEEQRAIAHILGTLDDKIELNCRQNETLEAMARALFRAWFVDFEPVRAKMNLPSPSGRGAGGEGKKPKLPADLLDFARELRHRMTDAEALLWRPLRNRQLAGVKFRRQHPFPPYVLDFYCHDHKLVVEIDGGQHNEDAGQRHDARRDAFLAEHGLRVLRFWNHDVLQQTEAVLEAIFQAIVEQRSPSSPSPPAPLPEGEGELWGTLDADGVWHWPQHILDLFPDHLVESELGEIPEGWRHSTIGEEVDGLCRIDTQHQGTGVLGRWATLLGNTQRFIRSEVSRFAGHGSKDYGCRSCKDQFWPPVRRHGVILFTGTNRLFGDCRSSYGNQPRLHRDEM